MLVTGAAGFIGFHFTQLCLRRGFDVVGIDDLNPYYDPTLKEARVVEIDRLCAELDATRSDADAFDVQRGPTFSLHRARLQDRADIESVFESQAFDRVVHLAAQAGVRHSLSHPRDYTDSNIVGFINILEGCRHHRVPHLVYASSSSVYGANTKIPFSVNDSVDHPISLYAATKKANELMAHSYSHLYELPTTGLRFFTVYGPWGRPDMALFLFTKSILEGKPIQVFNEGRMRRDFTYVDDIVEGVFRTAMQVPTPDPAWDSSQPSPGSSGAPFRVYNIGNNNTVQLMDFIHTLERCLGRTADKVLLPMQDGDVPETYANIDALQSATGFKPSTDIAVGIQRFVDWYREYYQVG
ncbi:MAG: NAD-dependent epimerase [Planctomycetota bacterium]